MHEAEDNDKRAVSFFFCHTVQPSNLGATKNTRSYRQSSLNMYLGIQRRNFFGRGGLLLQNKPDHYQLLQPVRSAETEPFCSGPSHCVAQCLIHHSSSPLKMHLLPQNTNKKINIQSFKYMPYIIIQM